MKIKHTTCLLFGILVLFFMNAEGSNLLELTGSRDSTNPLNNRMMSKGPEAAYFNPSLLPFLSEGMTVSLFFLYENMNINYHKKHLKYNVGEEIYNADPTEANRTGDEIPLDEQHLSAVASDDLVHERGSHNPDNGVAYLGFGLVKKILPEYLHLGIYAYFPVGMLQKNTPFYNDEREQYFSNSLHFELLEDRSEVFNITFGLGSHISRYFSIGAGASVSSNIVTVNDIYVPNPSQPSVTLINVSMEMKTVVSPLLAIYFDPLSLPFKLSLTLHLPYTSTDIAITNRTQMWQWNDYPIDEETGEIIRYLESKMKYSYGYLPLRAAFAGVWSQPILSSTLNVAGQIVYNKWDSYINRHGETPVDSWFNTISATVGANLELGDSRSFGVDVSYIPTPVPDQTGRTNYIDNSRIAFASGWREKIDRKTMGFEIAVTALAELFLERKTEKKADAQHPVVDEFPEMDGIDGKFLETSVGFQTNNPGFPGFTTKGVVFSGGISFKALF